MPNWSRVALISGLLLLVYWGSARILVWPQELKGERLLSELRLTRNKRAAILHQKALRISQEQRWRQLAADVAAVRLDIPPRSQITKLIAQLPELARRQRVNLQGVTYKPLSRVFENYQLLEFVLPLSGEYAAVRRFIFELEKLRLPLVINSVNLKQSQTSGAVSLLLQASAYYEAGK